ncbi:Peptidase C15 pyroglutamyl peptidase I-like [Trinorchestia longiramus]|nr:Peptidase C15 pyroglutamyl peptidase I-like [Trinorchestia longiramus]
MESILKSSTEKPVIYLTGFGPFSGFSVNASDAAVSLVVKTNLASDLGVRLVSETLDVDYCQTQNIVPQRWSSLKPKLVVHVGVAGSATKLTLEEQACNNGYSCLDINRACPPNLCCIPGGKDVIRSSLPLAAIAEAINKNANIRLKCQLSQDPGKYLCSYVYYTSLNKDASRSVFVHVPPLEVSSAEDTAQALSEAITLLYKAVLQADDTASAEENRTSETQCAALSNGVMVQEKSCQESVSLLENGNSQCTENAPRSNGKACGKSPPDSVGECVEQMKELEVTSST